MEWCTACSSPVRKFKLSCVHVLTSCSAVNTLREASGVRAFMDECRQNGFDGVQAYDFFLNGKGVDGVINVSVQEYVGRGHVLIDVQKAWLAVWRGEVGWSEGFVIFEKHSWVF
jgi:hypothetical protein